MSDNVANEASSWPTWKIALAVGVPVVVGVGCYYLYSSSKASKSNEKPSESPAKEKSQNSRVDPEGSSSPQTPKAAENLPKPAEKPVPILSKREEAQNYKTKGNQLFKDGHYQDAIDQYTKAISVCPDDQKSDKSTYHQNKAAALEKMSDWTGVIDECSAAIDLNQRYVKALQRRAKAYEKTGQKESCLEDITTVCILESFQNPGTMVYADNVLKELGKEKAAEKFKTRKPKMPSGLFIKQYFTSFHDDVISNPLTDEMKAMSSTSGYIRAKILLETGDYDGIIKQCSEEIEAPKAHGETVEISKDQQSFYVEALVLRATFHVLTGNSEDALQDLNEVINMNDANIKLKANALIKRGSLSMQLQDTVKAEADFTLASNVDPDNCDVYHHRGQLCILLDKPDEALADFDKCIQLRPDFAMAYAQRCYTKYRQALKVKNDYEIERAMEEFDLIIQKYPNCSETYGLYAQAHTDKEDYAKADKLFQEAIKLEPDNATLYVHRGLLALQWKQDIDQAVKLITKALEVDEKCDFAHETMGTIEVQRGNLDSAKKHFDESIEFAKTELELAHLYALRAAAVAQSNIASKYGLRPSIPTMM